MTKGNDRDCVPRPVPFDLQSRYCAAGIEDALASGTAPRVFVVLGGRCFDLQSAYQTTFADFLCFIIRKRRFAGIVCIGFLNEEYLIASVDFIVALRRTKGRGRRTLRSPPSPSSGLHLIHPGNPLRRGMNAAAGLQGFSQLVSGADCLLPLRYIVWVLCVRAWTVRVSVDFVGNKSFVFHWWWDRLFVPAATLGFVMVYCWDYR